MKYNTNLENVFNNTRMLISNISASTLLIEEMEIYGYVTDEMVDKFGDSNMINLDGSNRIVCSDRIFQLQPVIENTCYGSSIKSIGITIPIFKSAKKEEEDMCIPLKQIYVPSLVSNPLYIAIRSRTKNGICEVNEYKLSKNKMPDNIIVVEKEAYYKTTVGDIICRDKYGNIKGVCNNIMAVCRYINQTTGSMNYTILPLEDIYVKSDIYS